MISLSQSSTEVRVSCAARPLKITRHGFVWKTPARGPSQLCVGSRRPSCLNVHLDRLSSSHELQNSIVPAPGLVPVFKPDHEPSVPIYVATAPDFITPGNSLVNAEALRAGLKAMKHLGVHGVLVDVFWGLVEAEAPMAYDWAAYHSLFKLIRECGLKIQAQLCFHGQGSHTLPPWVLEEGRSNPDIFYTDRYTNRNTNCLTLGIDNVPALKGRTAVAAYADLMRAFSEEFTSFLGSSITQVSVGLGPDGELKYPAHCPSAGWAFPGTGEFQCYDRYMLGSLRACAQQAGQPAWGTGGPHDCGSYSQWAHESRFFSHDGSWSSQYGAFFLQWYSSMLLQHADGVMATAASTFAGTGVKLAARLPAPHWWYNQTSHAAELTAGYYNTPTRDGYLPVMKLLQRHGAGCHLGAAELRGSEQPAYALSDPETLMLQQRTAAAALQLQVTVGNQLLRFDEAAFSQLEHQLFSPMANRGLDLPAVNGVVFHRLCDQMFEPPNWHPLKRFLRRIRERADLAGEAFAAQRTLSPHLAAAAPDALPEPAAAQAASQRQAAASLV